MRVLFTTYAEKTHFLAMTPLAWALRTAGHEVRFASQPELTDVITQAGLTAVPVGRDHRIWRMIDVHPDWMEEGPTGKLSEPYDVAEAPAKATWEYLKTGYDNTVTWWHMMENNPMITDLVAFARYWEPDLVIWDPSSWAGSIAAKACGAAHARLMFTVDAFGITRDHYLRLKGEEPVEERGDAMVDWLGGYATKYGAEFSEDMVTGHFTIDQLPSSLQMEAGLHYVPMRYIPYGGAAVVPKWLWTQPERPRVALTLGLSTSHHLNKYAVRVQDVLDSLADLEIEIVATIAEKEQHKLGPIPDNTRIVSYVPLHALAPTCSAVIHHAGPGTLSTMALDAVPQLSLPAYYDEPALARALAAQGSGLAIPAGEATGQTIRENLLRLLNEPSFRENARRLRDEMRSLPSPNELVGELEELTTKLRGTTSAVR
jgi:glycosyltransferase (activator-dependent family)